MEVRRPAAADGNGVPQDERVPPPGDGPEPDREVTDTGANRIELELKFRLRDKPAGERYLRGRGPGRFKASSPRETVRLLDRYVDTADGALRQRGLAARLRMTEGGTLISVKSLVNAAGETGLHRRDEVEGPADEVRPVRDWPASAARALVLDVCGDEPLVELATLRQVRHRRRLRFGATHVEVSLDEVEVLGTDEVVDTFTELEVELLGGDPARLEELRDVLAADPALRPARQSKLDAALLATRDAASRTPSRAADARSGGVGARPDPASGTDHVLDVGEAPGVLGSDAAAEAARKVLRFHLARMLAREAGVRAGTSAEDLKKMRVATRRMRAAWLVFGFALDPHGTRRLRRRLRALARSLGAVRDLDVLLERVEIYRAALPPADRTALDVLVVAWQDQRAAAHAALLRELDSRGHARFVRDFRKLVTTEGAAALAVGPAVPQLVRETAPSRLWAALEEVRAYERVLRSADVPALHELRITAKRLRYTIEFLAEALGPEAGMLVERTVLLQDHLGALNDADVTAARVRRLLAERPDLRPTEAEAIERYARVLDAEVQRLRGSVAPAWRAVTGLSFRRRLGRLAAGL